MPPHTLASMATFMPAWMARSQISGPRGGHQFLVGRHHGLAVADGLVEDLRRDGGPAHHLHHDLHIGMRHHFAPVRGLHNVAERRRASVRSCTSRLHAAASFSRNPSLHRDLIGILGQDRDRSRAHIAQADNAHIHFIHIKAMISGRKMGQ